MDALKIGQELMTDGHFRAYSRPLDRGEYSDASNFIIGQADRPQLASAFSDQLTLGR